MAPHSDLLQGKVGLVVGVANEQSIAAGCAAAFHAAGARICLTHQSEKSRKFVEPVASAVGADLFLPLDVTDAEQTAAVFDAIHRTWGRLNVLLHSIAFCPPEDLHGRVVDC